MAVAIKEVTDFSADITLLDLLTTKARWRIESIVVTDAGSGGISIKGYNGEITTLTDVQDNEQVTVLGATKILAAGTSVGKVRISFGVISG